MNVGGTVFAQVMDLKKLKFGSPSQCMFWSRSWRSASK